MGRGLNRPLVGGLLFTVAFWTVVGVSVLHGLTLQLGCHQATPTAGGDKAILVVSPQAIDLSSTVGAPLPHQAVHVTNGGKGALKWDVEAPSQPWLTVSPTSGTNDGTLTLAFQTTALIAGDHLATFQVTAPDQPAAPVNVRLVLGVTAPVEICGDGQDNDGDGQIDENPPCVPPPDPVGCPAGAVTVAPGANIQAAIDSQATGATICLQAGVHRITAPLQPKTGQTLRGVTGAVLSGARLLTPTRSGAYWVATGQTQQGKVSGSATDGVCQSEAPRCGYPEDLFLNDVLLQHVATLAEVGPGTWYFDYAADTIYFADDPTGTRVETSVAPMAVMGWPNTVRIATLTVEKFATATHDAAINGQGTGWIVEDSEVRWNHFAGIRTGEGVRASRNRVHHNGAFGVIGAGSGIVVEDNEISYNNTNRYSAGWGAGGSKWVYTTGLIVRRNFSHHNWGVGLWTDINNINSLYEQNRVEDNDYVGIFHEISYQAIIRNNHVSRNGRIRPYPGWVDGAGILVAGSPDVEVYGNTLVDNYQGICGLEGNRGTGNHGAYTLQNLHIHDNTTTAKADYGSGSGRTGIVGDAAFATRNNRYVNNTYHLGSAARYFVWLGEKTEQEWVAAGQDVTGKFIR